MNQPLKSSTPQCSRDPMCGWDRDSSVCRSYQPSLVHDPTGVKDNLCQVRSGAEKFSLRNFFFQASIFKRKLIANFGQSIHLSCSVGRSVSTQVSFLIFLSLDPLLSPYHDPHQSFASQHKWVFSLLSLDSLLSSPYHDPHHINHLCLITGEFSLSCLL